MKQILTLAALALMAAPAAAQEPADEPQWIYRPASHGSNPTSAAFLAWDYSGVIVLATCKEGALVIEYFPETPMPETPQPLILILDDQREIAMETTVLTQRPSATLRGTLPATAELAEALDAAEHIQLDAPNEMGEPWHLGQSERLVRIARDCAA